MGGNGSAQTVTPHYKLALCPMIVTILRIIQIKRTLDNIEREIPGGHPFVDRPSIPDHPCLSGCHLETRKSYASNLVFTISIPTYFFNAHDKMSRHSLDSPEQPHESPGFVAPENLIEEEYCCSGEKFEKLVYLPDTVPFSSFQPCVKCFHAGKESELEMKLCSIAYFWHNINN